jgi:hypothetical protein
MLSKNNHNALSFQYITWTGKHELLIFANVKQNTFGIQRSNSVIKTSTDG